MLRIAQEVQGATALATIGFTRRRLGFGAEVSVSLPPEAEIPTPYPVLYIYSADRRFKSMDNAQIDLRSGAMVETKQPAEPLGAFDGARSGFGANGRLDQPIIEPLMIPFPMIVSGVLASGLSKRSLAEEDHSIKTLILDRPDESFGVRVQVGRTRRQAHDFETSILY